MLVADSVLGNVRDDPEFAARYEAGDGVEVLAVDDVARKRSRFRATTDAGTDVGVVLGETTVDPGDVLHADDERLIVVRFAEREALVVDLADAAADLPAAVELGHALGNRHRDLATRGDEVVIPVPDSRERLEREVRPRLPEGATLRYEDVDPTLFDDADAPEHGHDHEHGHGGSGATAHAARDGENR